MSKAKETTDDEPQREGVMNPVLRRMFQAKFVDGKWWTTEGMADALGGDLADDLAVRYYLYVNGAVTGDSLTTSQLVRAARRCCVTRSLNNIPATIAEVKKEGGKKFYKFKPLTRQRVTAGGKPLPQTTPGDTRTGISTFGLLAAIAQLPSPALADDLVRLLLPAMRPIEELVAWHQSKFSSISVSGENSKSHAVVRRAAVAEAVYQAIQNHPISMEWRFVVVHNFGDAENKER